MEPQYAFLTKEPWTMIFLQGLPFTFQEFLAQLSDQGPLSKDEADWRQLALGEDRQLPDGYLPLRTVHSGNIVERGGQFQEASPSTHHSHWGKLVGPQEGAERIVQVLVDREVFYRVGGTIVRAYDLVKLSRTILRAEYSGSFKEGHSLVRFEALQVWRICNIQESEEDWVQFVCVPFQKSISPDELPSYKGHVVTVEYVYDPIGDGAAPSGLDVGFYNVSLKATLMDVQMDASRLLESIEVETSAGQRIIFPRSSLISVLSS